MQLVLQSQNIEDVAVVRCQGRIVAGAEADALRRELENLTRVRKKVVLQLADVGFIDSAGLGALVRLFGVLQNAGGGLKLCQLSPFVLQVLQVTNLLYVFHTYSSENEAVEAFSERPRSAEETVRLRQTLDVCPRDIRAFWAAQSSFRAERHREREKARLAGGEDRIRTRG